MDKRLPTTIFWDDFDMGHVMQSYVPFLGVPM
jgi:hypothetical protein